jgi:hypothetical protein
MQSQGIFGVSMDNVFNEWLEFHARNRRQADRMGSTPDTEVYEAIRSSAPAR